MEFWGVEVKVGEPLQCSPGEERVVHISQASLGEKKKDKANETVYIYVKINEKKFVIGTLSHDKFPQFVLDLVFEKDFELSHSGKNVSVHFAGYIVPTTEESDGSELEDKSEEEAPATAVIGIPASRASLAKKADAKEKVIGNKDLDDSDESDDDTSLTNGDDESGDEDDTSDSGDEDDTSDSDGEETPKKVEPAVKKRAADSAAKIPAHDKKAKFVSPQKSDGKKVTVHVATPYPTKKSEKKSSVSTSSDQKKDATPKGSVICTTCSRTFGTEKALESHSKAKHGST